MSEFSNEPTYMTSDSILQIPRGAVDTQNTTSSSDETNVTTITQYDNKPETRPILDSKSPSGIMTETEAPTTSQDVIQNLTEKFAEHREHNKKLSVLRSVSGMIESKVQM